jgi:hypothetical protein
MKLEIEICIVSMKYLPLRNAFHMPKEERLRTRFCSKNTVASPKTRVPKDRSTHAKEPTGLQKSSEWAQGHVIVFYGMFGSLGYAGVVVTHAVCVYVGMLVCSRYG